MAAKSKKQKNYTVAKGNDGSLQITFTIDFNLLKTKREEIAKERSVNVEVAGFRKGKAPLDKVIEKIGVEDLNTHALNRMLPKMFTDAVISEKLKPAMMPKFELIKVEEGKDWEIRANTCELPKFEIGDYKKAIKTIKSPKKVKLTKEEKEQKIIDKLITSIEMNLPEILVEDEINSRLSSLLQRLEKLGLTLEGYLSSIKKTGEELRKEYREQSVATIKLDLILAKISDEEKVKINEKEVEGYLEASKIDPNYKPESDEEQKRLIRSILKRKAVLDKLTELM